MVVAPAFHEVIVPSSVLVMIASSEEETMAASLADSNPSSSGSVMSEGGSGPKGRSPDNRFDPLREARKPSGRTRANLLSQWSSHWGDVADHSNAPGRSPILSRRQLKPMAL